MSVWAVPGQDRATTLLRDAVRREEVSHAWAFLGPAGVGQTRAARALAAALLCRQQSLVGAGDPCGQCDACARSLRGAHSDYWEFAPTGSVHRVADVREQWLRTASRSSAEGGWKLLRILDADRMNEAAANAFLKGLEEPPARTVWILDVADPDELPDTILSRCRTVRFAPWGPEDLDAEARRLGIDDPVDRRLAVRACMGVPAGLARFAAPGGLDDLRAHRAIPARLRAQGPGVALLAARALDEEVKRRTAAMKAEGREELESLSEFYGDEVPTGVRKQLGDRWARREREARTTIAQAALDDLAMWLRDVLLVGSGGDPAHAVHFDDPEGLRADAEGFRPATLLEALDDVMAVREQLELNLQQQLALEGLFMRLSALAIRG